MTKSEIMARIIMGNGHETFTHSIEGHFDVTLMRNKAIAEKREPVLVPVALLVDHLRTNYVHEAARVRHFVEKFTQTPDLYDPAMFVSYQDGTSLLVDGVHRVLAADYLRMEHYIFWRFTEDEIIRPDFNLMGFNPERDWGDALVDGKIVKRT